MANVIKLRKGLDINLKGKPEPRILDVKPSRVYALKPADSSSDAQSDGA